MQLWDLKKSIVENSVPHFLVFGGEERTLMYTYINEIVSRLKVDKICVENIVDAYNAATTKSLLSLSKKLILVKEDKACFSDTKMIEALKRSSNYVIVMIPNIDKRAQYYKALEQNTVVFDKMSSDILFQALKPVASIQDSYLKWLIEVCDRDYGRCLLELDKVTVFPKDKQNDLFATFARDGIIYCQIPDCIFDFSNAVLKRDRRMSFSLWEDLKLRGDSSLQLFTVLYNNFKNLMLVQLARNATKENTGLEEKQIKGIKWNVGKYSDMELFDAVELIGNLDSSIKQGTITELMAMEYFLARTL